MNEPRGADRVEDQRGADRFADERAGAAPRDPLLALDPWLLFLLGMVVALQVTGDPAFATLRQGSRWDGEVVRTVLAVGAVATLLLFLTAALALPGGVERRSYRTWKRATLVALGVLILALPIAGRAVQRFASGQPLRFAHDGGVIQTEESARFLLRGIDPYGADYSKTPLAGVAIPGILRHNPYLPASFLLPAPLIALADAAGWPFDQRLVYLLLYAAGVWLAPLAFCHRGAGELAQTCFALNPLVVPYVVVGRNDIYVISFLLFALVALARRRPLAFFSCLALACALKQFAWFVAPFLLVCAWHAWPRPIVRRGLVVAAAIFAALVLPFFFWGPAAFVDDVYRFNAGLSPDSYPLGGTPGFGFAMLAAALRWAPDRAAYFSLTPYLLATALPLGVLLLARLLRRPAVGQAMLAAFLVSFWIFFFSRVFNNNYFGVLAFLLQMGALATADSVAPPGSERH
ncbi:MAG TPA: hypothetical protein VHG32_18495 [Thermoanaerobaculia bacterium]|jgi:hypothetical protein|nr:hypothetical protein [Thermoanaerobaculia bacterium]